jgi:hypothetical protein
VPLYDKSIALAAPTANDQEVCFDGTATQTLTAAKLVNNHLVAMPQQAGNIVTSLRKLRHHL